MAHDPEVLNSEAVEAAEWLSGRQGLVLDVRDPWEYAEGRVPGALSLPQADLALRLAEVPKDRDVLVVCASGNRSLRAAGCRRSAIMGHF